MYLITHTKDKAAAYLLACNGASFIAVLSKHK